MSMQKIKVRGQMSRSQISWPHLAVSAPQLQFEFAYGDEMMHKAWCCLEEVSYYFSKPSVKFQGHGGQKNHQFWPALSVSGLWLKFYFTGGFEMMCKAWRSIDEVSYCFSRSSVNFQGHGGQKITIFYPNWAFPDCNSSLNIPMALKCCIKLNVVYKRFSIVFQGHPSNFKVTRDEKIANFDPNRAFPDCNSSLTSPMDMNETMHKAWRSVEEVFYCFTRWSINFQGHEGQKITNFFPELSVSGL